MVNITLQSAKGDDGDIESKLPINGQPPLATRASTPTSAPALGNPTFSPVAQEMAGFKEDLLGVIRVPLTVPDAMQRAVELADAENSDDAAIETANQLVAFLSAHYEGKEVTIPTTTRSVKVTYAKGALTITTENIEAPLSPTNTILSDTAILALYRLDVDIEKYHNNVLRLFGLITQKYLAQITKGAAH